MTVPFGERLAQAVGRVGAPCVVGLDPHLERLPRPLRETFAGCAGRERRRRAAEAVVTWGEGVLEAVHGRVPMVKPQVAFFEALGGAGWEALEHLCAAARSRGLLVLADAKRGDIGSTAEAYAVALLDDDGPVGADAVTASPYLGPESLAPLLARGEAGKGVFVLLRTSNPGAGELQLAVADRVAGWIREANAGAAFGRVGAVVGATLAEEAGHWRAALPGTWLLVPGYGAQGATAQHTLPCFTAEGTHALVVSARGVTFPDAGDEARYDADPVGVVRERCAAFVADVKGALVGRIVPG